MLTDNWLLKSNRQQTSTKLCSSFKDIKLVKVNYVLNIVSQNKSCLLHACFQIGYGWFMSSEYWAQMRVDLCQVNIEPRWGLIYVKWILSPDEGWFMSSEYWAQMTVDLCQVNIEPRWGLIYVKWILSPDEGWFMSSEYWAQMRVDLCQVNIEPRWGLIYVKWILSPDEGWFMSSEYWAQTS